jgi:hypothetical protein
LPPASAALFNGLKNRLNDCFLDTVSIAPTLPDGFSF